MKIYKYIFKYTYIFTYITYPYVLREIFIILQSYDIFMLQFLSDVIPYYYQIISSELDHKKANEFSVVLSY